MIGRRLIAAGLAVAMASAASAFSLLGIKWSPGTIPMHLQLGPSGGALMDGSADWGASATAALSSWNSHIAAATLAAVPNSPEAQGEPNGINNVFFSNTIYGFAFGGSTLAVTSLWAIGSTTTDADVIFNTAFTWNSYPGALLPGIIDFRRVAAHEFGHVLGLGHPNQAGQSVSALMNSTISNLDSLTADDIAGAVALYGASAPPAPAPPPGAPPAPTNPPTIPGTHTLTIRKAGTGSGVVTSDPDGIDCGAICAADFSALNTISLRARPASGSSFQGYSGGAACREAIDIKADLECTATFDLIETVPPPAPPPPVPTVPDAPTNEIASVDRGVVTLGWVAPTTGATVTGYILQAGSAPGAADLSSHATGGVATTFVATAPPGIYFVRVLAVAGPVVGPPSGDVTVFVTDGPEPCGPIPAAPAGLNAAQAGSDLLLTWTEPATGPVETYVVEVGNGPGLTNVASIDTGSTVTRFMRSGIPPGVYVIRVRARNACGVGLPSNEQSLVFSASTIRLPD